MGNKFTGFQIYLDETEYRIMGKYIKGKMWISLGILIEKIWKENRTRITFDSFRDLSKKEQKERDEIEKCFKENGLL